MDRDAILVTEKDYMRIKQLLGARPAGDLENLELELDRANLIADNEVPKNLVTMNSKVRFMKMDREQIVELVYPNEADLKAGKVSVLAPLGSALLGLSEGQEINWQFPNQAVVKLKVLEVLYQPEANGDWHR